MKRIGRVKALDLLPVFGKDENNEGTKVADLLGYCLMKMSVVYLKVIIGDQGWVRLQS